MNMKLKLIAVGNSTGVILPKELLEKLRAKKGDELHALETPDGFRLTQFDEELDRQLEVAERVMREDRGILRKLAE
jgi:putative addiction module antidote